MENDNSQTEDKNRLALVYENMQHPGQFLHADIGFLWR